MSEGARAAVVGAAIGFFTGLELLATIASSDLVPVLQLAVFAGYVAAWSFFVWQLYRFRWLLQVWGVWGVLVILVLLLNLVFWLVDLIAVALKFWPPSAQHWLIPGLATASAFVLWLLFIAGGGIEEIPASWLGEDEDSV